MYELSYLISGAVAEANVGKVAEVVEKEIKTIKGRIINQVNPIKRKLSYPIKKQNFAYFVTLYFDAPKDTVKELNQFFRLDNNVLRHLLIESTESAMNDYLRRQKSDTQERKQDNKEEVISKVEVKAEATQETLPSTPVIEEEKQAEPIDEEEAPKEEIEETAKVEEEKEAADINTSDKKPEETPEAKKEKMRIEDIDKKIDEILNKTEI